MATMLFNCTHGTEDAERATLPFVAAGVAAASGQRAIVVCTVDAVWLGTTGGRADVHAPGMPPLDELYRALIDAGGEVWLCSSCTVPRAIDESMCDDGASIRGAAAVIAEMADGAQAVSFA